MSVAPSTSRATFPFQCTGRYRGLPEDSHCSPGMLAVLVGAPLMLSATFATPPRPFDGQPPSSTPYRRPVSAGGLRSYLLGEWELKKVMIYKAGGVSGRFEGSAKFDPFAPNVLRYEEEGEFSRQGSEDAVSTRNSLLYDFSSSSKVDVFFDAAAEHSSGPEEIIEQARFLHSIRPDTLELFDHVVENEDVCEGQIEITRAEAFMLTWSVGGPRQEGQILSLFTRVTPPEELNLSLEDLIKAEILERGMQS